MKDVLLKFGEITAATKATVAYSADVLDMGATRKTGNLDNINVCFKAKAANASGDTASVQIYESSDNSTFTLLLQGPDMAFGKDEVFAIPMPKEHKRYLKAAVLPASTGTFTSTKFDAWIQPGK